MRGGSRANEIEVGGALIRSCRPTNEVCCWNVKSDFRIYAHSSRRIDE